VPYAIELVLDDGGAAPIRDAWRRLAEEGIGTAMHGTESRPHPSLGVADDVDPPALERLAAEVAAAIGPVPVVFSSVGVFATDPAVVFLAPVVTPALLRLHEDVQTRFAGVATRPWPHYAPGAWVPHCTVAIDVARADLGRALALAVDAVRLPLSGTLDRIGVVRFRPVTEQLLLPLRGVA
jgi:hypothetical protein